jgi:hypothetical protein
MNQEIICYLIHTQYNYANFIVGNVMISINIKPY